MATEPTNRPNIVLLMADDLGSWAISAYGNPEIHTPHIDALAARGTRFTSFYCTSPVCSPARASLLTGQMPSVHGVHDWILPASPTGHLDRFLEGQETFVDVLASSGYEAGLFGKWHLGDARQAQAGFSRWVALEASHGPYTDAEFLTDEIDDDTSGYVTDVIADKAITFIRQHTDASNPYLASVNFTAPHHPWVDQHPRRITDLYSGCDFESCPQEPPHPWLHPSLAPAVRRAYEDPVPSLTGYFAAVTAMDEAIGRVVRELQSTGALDATLVIFTSDNGYQCGHHGIWGKGNATWPLNVYERSVTVPCIVAGPGWSAGEVSDVSCSAYDIFPTLLDFAGVEASPMLRPGAPLPRRGSVHPDEVVVCDEYGATRMIRFGSHKLVLRYPDGPNELYDLGDDPDERSNLIDDPQRCAVRNDLRSRLEVWFDRYASGPYDARRYEVTGRGQATSLQNEGNQ